MAIDTARVAGRCACANEAAPDALSGMTAGIGKTRGSVQDTSGTGTIPTPARGAPAPAGIAGERDDALRRGGARLAVAVAIATTGRKDTLRLSLPQLLRQTRPPDRVIVSVCSEDDVDRAHLATLPLPVEVVLGEKGLTHQRNTALAALGACDVVVFLDDDFVMAPDFLAETAALFAARADVVVATGAVIADGIDGPGLTLEEGLERLAADGGPDPAKPDLAPTYGAYGCNMALRLGPMRAHAIGFDERLPLYGWLEDIDLSRQLAAHGAVVRSRRLRGVHLGEKRGRSSGVKLGYSQVANPVYLVRKGTVRPKFAYRYLVRNVAKNLWRAPWPEPWIDRAGRLRGNLMALRDLLTGRLSPERILDIGR